MRSGLFFLSTTKTRALPPVRCSCEHDALELAAPESPLGNVAERPSACARFVPDPACLLRMLGVVRAEEALGRPTSAFSTTEQDLDGLPSLVLLTLVNMSFQIPFSFFKPLPLGRGR